MIFGNIVDLNSFRSNSKFRLSSLEKLYCKASDMPALISEVKRPLLKENSDFRIVTIHNEIVTSIFLIL